MIEVKHLTKRYGSFLAVDDLSFTVEDGQITGFLGPNGAGKSTTMNILTGYLSANEGTVLINGHDIFTEPEAAKKELGYLPEIPPLYTDMTTREYLNFVADLKKTPRETRKKELAAVMKTTGVTEMADRLIKNLSKGYRQRVGIAQALIGRPKVIILDEPTVGLDPLQMIEIRNLIRSLAKEHTVILSSHILSEVSNICDKVLIIAHGRLVAQDTPENLADRMRGCNSCRLVARGAAETVRAVLAKLPFTKAAVTPGKNGTVTAELESPSDCDLREQLFYALAESRCPILELNVTTLSLEQVFLELTGTDKSADKAAKKRARRVADETRQAAEAEEPAGDGETQPDAEPSEEPDAEKPSASAPKEAEQ